MTKKIKKRRGRPSLEDRFGPEKVKRAYQTYKTLRRTAKALGVSHVALIDFFKRHEIPVKSHKEATKFSKRTYARHTSPFAKWLLANRGIPLPRDLQQLADLSGCTRNAVACYFYRRRFAIKRVLYDVPKLTTVSAILEDELGNQYNTRNIKKYEYLIDKFTLKVKILAEMKDKHSIVIPVPDPKTFLERILELTEGRTASHQRVTQESLSKPETLSTHPPDPNTPLPVEHIEVVENRAFAQDTETETPRFWSVR